MKSLVHGSTGFLDQMGKKVITLKYLCAYIQNENFQSIELTEFIQKKYGVLKETDRSQLQFDLERRQLNDTEKSLLKTDYDDSCKSAFIASKLKIDGRLFHSLSYSRRGTINSYGVSYLKRNKKKYGQIEYFIEYKSRFYAFIRRVRVHQSIKEFLPKGSGFFFNAAFDLVNMYYKVVKTNDLLSFDLIPAEAICNRCVIVPSGMMLFLTELICEYEHD